MSTLRGEQPSRLSPCTHHSSPAPWQGSVLPQTTPLCPSICPSRFLLRFLAPRGTGTHRLPRPPAPAGSRGRSAPRPWLLRERGEWDKHLQEMGHQGARGGLRATHAQLQGRSPGLSPPCHQRRRANTRQPQILVPWLCPGHPRARRIMGGEGCAGKGCSRQAARHFPWICAVF